MDARVKPGHDTESLARPCKLPLSHILNVIIRQHTQGSAVDIIVLAALERPQEGKEAGEAQPQRHRHQIDQDVHDRLPRARSAFSVTSSDDPDIANAAIKGVTAPEIAIGTAIAL